MEAESGTHAERHAQRVIAVNFDEVLQRRLDEAEAAKEAVDGLSRRTPEFSARFGLSPGQRAGGWAALGAVTAFLVLDANGLATTLMLLASLSFSLIIAMRLAAALTALISRPPAIERPAPAENLRSLSVLVPLFGEANVVSDLVDALEALDYPEALLNVIFLVEIDDEPTLMALRLKRLRPGYDILPVPAAGPRTKPKALNYGLRFCRGDLVVIFDAEDRPDPIQPRAAARAFHDGPRNLAVVQAPLLAHNGEACWIARQFALEYAIHFKVWLPFLSRLRAPLALGGTSNYFDRRRLIEAGGWDPFNVTEDADLGLRLARFGGAAVMIAPPTWEEAPVRFRDWFNQRTRWTKGHLQTWLVLMRNPVGAIQDLGVAGFLLTQINLGGSLLAAMMHAPVLAWIILGLATPLPEVSGWYIGLLGVGYGAAVAAAVGSRHATLKFSDLLGFVAYWPMASAAMMRALWELKSRPHLWAKTPHGVAVGRSGSSNRGV